MQDFSIGLSGYSAAQKALDIVGNNIANAATEGYHRQEVSFTPSYMSDNGGTTIGGGVEIREVRRIIDNLLEEELMGQSSSLAELDRKLSTMSSVEATFGELSTNSGLNGAIDNFFAAISDVSAHTGDSIYLTDLVSSAEIMAGKFNSLGTYLTDLKSDIYLETQSLVQEANNLIGLIANLNDQISSLSITGADPNNLIDQRGQYINELAELVGIQTREGENGVIDINVGGVPVVMNSTAMNLQVGRDSGGHIGIAAAGSGDYDTDIEGGSIGGLMSLYNEFVDGIQSQLDTLAASIASAVNRYHVQGINAEGSFTELTGNYMLSEDLSDYASYIEDGYVYVRVTDTSTNQVTRTAVQVDADTDTMTGIAAKLSAVTGITASYAGSKLIVEADAGYEFDFSPMVKEKPENSTLSGNVPDVSVGGIYTGTENDTFTFTVSGTGETGNGSLELVVTNSDNETINTIQVGSGYAAGDTINVADGITVQLGVGELNDGESFQVNVFANTDTSGLLSAAGLNTFFSGSSASSISVSTAIASDPKLVASSLGSDGSDNTNASRMAGLKDEALSGLGGLTAGDYYKQLVTAIGQDVSVTTTKQESAESIVSSLQQQQSEISGVDVNDEAAQMIVFQQLIQASAKYLSAVQESLDIIMNIL